MLGKEATKCQKKKSVGLISKKTTLNVQHTFLYISLPFFCTTTTRNFQKVFFSLEKCPRDSNRVKSLMKPSLLILVIVLPFVE